MIPNHKIKKLLYGTDASNEISLFEYGFLVGPAEKVNPEQCHKPEGEELFVVYKRHVGFGYGQARHGVEPRYFTGYIEVRQLDALIKGEEWMTEKDIEEFLSCNGATKDEWLELSPEYKLGDLIGYYGVDEIMGSDYWEGLSEEEVREKYLDEEVN